VNSGGYGEQEVFFETVKGRLERRELEVNGFPRSAKEGQRIKVEESGCAVGGLGLRG